MDGRNPMLSIILHLNENANVEKCLNRIHYACKGVVDYEVLILSPVGQERSYMATAANISHTQIENGTFVELISAIAKAKGRYTVFIDQNDTLIKDAVRLFCEKAKNADIDLFEFNVTYIDQKGYIGPLPDPLCPYFDFNAEKSKAIKLGITLTGKIVSTEIIKRIAAYSCLPQRGLGKDIHYELLIILVLFAIKRASRINANLLCKIEQRIISPAKEWPNIIEQQGMFIKLLDACSDSYKDNNYNEFITKIHESFLAANMLFTRYMHDTEVHRLFRSLLDIYPMAIIIRYVTKKNFNEFCKAISQRERAKKISSIKHIAILVGKLRLGGLERVAALLGDLFIANNYQVTFFTDEPPQSNDFQYNAKIQRIVLPRDWTERLNFLQANISENNIDLCIVVEHLSLEWMFFTSIIYTTQAHCVNMDHSSFFRFLYFKQPEILSIKVSAYKLADAVSCLSKFDASLWHHCGISQAVVIQNPPTFDIRKHSFRKAKFSAKTIVNCGRLDDDKGATLMPYVLQLVHKHVKDAKLLFVGKPKDNQYEKKLKTIISRLNLQNSISFTGHVSNVETYYSRSSIHVLPSPCEGFSLVLREAKAHGLPSVLFRMVNLELSSEEDGSIMVGKEDVIGMADAIIRLMQDEEYWTMMSERCLLAGLKESSEICMRQWQFVFDKLLMPGNNHAISATNEDIVPLPDVLEDFHAGLCFSISM